MKNLFKPGLLIVGIIFVLTVIFTSIMYFQGKPPSLPSVTPIKQPESEPATPIVTDPVSKKTRVAQRSVDIAFTAGEKKLEYSEVPLFKVLYQNDQQVEVIADGDKIKELIENLPLPATEKQQTPAKYEKKTNGFARIVRGEPGYSIDKEKTLAAFEKKVTENHDAEKLEVAVVMNTTGEDFKKISIEKGFTQLITSFSTEHDADHINDENRNENLRVAAENIDGLIIPPGGKFSFNKVVGPRTEKFGFKKAGVISQGRVIPGLGGGICQVSTTLYRAVLMSGMKIDERHNHSIYDGINYAQRGLDAAVAWGYKDFRFTNNLDIPILLSCRSGKGSVKLEIYAEKKPFDEIVLETKNEVKHPYKVQKKTNTALKKGEIKIVHPGVHGYSIEVFRRITQSGKTREERLSKDRYLTYNRIEESNN